MQRRNKKRNREYFAAAGFEKRATKNTRVSRHFFTFLRGPATILPPSIFTSIYICMYKENWERNKKKASNCQPASSPSLQIILRVVVVVRVP
jgi:hypothetical protein